MNNLQTIIIIFQIITCVAALTASFWWIHIHGDNDECIPFTGGLCGKGKTERNHPCSIKCGRPDIKDWGYFDDEDDIRDFPSKGWYDVSGQGEPNDFCRVVGNRNAPYFACDNTSQRYLATSINNKAIVKGPAIISLDSKTATDKGICTTYENLPIPLPDSEVFKQSVEAGMRIDCTRAIVFNIYKPIEGWEYSNGQWVFFANRHSDKALQNQAIERYNKLHQIQDSFKILQ